MTFLEDHSTGFFYPAMTDTERVAASINTGYLHWVGANVAAASGPLSAGKVGTHVQMYAPNPQQVGSSVSHFDPSLTPTSCWSRPNSARSSPSRRLRSSTCIGPLS